ncbi:hypothetical protein LPH50_01460 [Xylella taiwanensis]|uniref:Uncharacterized protein n=2 Tax=Xylella taiwanensis TaxID=1444770 RepID=A0ABS8TQQ6_9GAMM|nr:hypothetical protein [Xylella taiwanensis]MCD8456909.1 hypothetical protein [Xylella taiwanensis]MCD8459321.1 hypothetical protein [Xylella taiwanensis]MCD8461808.1 hypothetical protein [Xylella taiwanensis]MCD8462159.1 hypothetical protein [Xylella taiwanensis]MCD8465946.1 hypothetical protein [Xylella taiwanensis]
MSRTEPVASAMGVLVLELAGDTVPAHAALRPDQAGVLAEHVGCDLAQWVPQVSALELSFAAAHFDPAEVLRPGWPLHRYLEELQTQVPRCHQGPRVLAFGANVNGEVPLPFRADSTLNGGRLRVLPFLLSGVPEQVDAVAEVLEEVLLTQGMVQANTALLAQAVFSAQIEHARYMTVHDLVAMMSIQYDNQGLGILWPLLEAALLAPRTEEWLDAPPQPLLRYISGEVRMALFDLVSWCAYYQQDCSECERLSVLYQQFLARQRQFCAVLDAHGVIVSYVRVGPGQDARLALVA